MDNIGGILNQRYEQIIVENEMLRAGFAALPYVVLRDTRLSLGARLAYSTLLSYAWQDEACFAGQEKMARDMGVSERHLRRFLVELEEFGYVRIKRQGLNRPNLYFIVDVKTKLNRAKKRGGPDTGVRSREDTGFRSRPDTGVRLLDSD
jgi:hypothetical protein